MTQTKWDSANMPDQKGRIAIVTGSSSGIGDETARALAEKNATVIIAVRNITKGENAAKKIKALNKQADVKVMVIDLSDLKSVRSFAEAFKQKFKKLDLLINNAGVMIPPYGKTKDGFELQFGTNHLGHFALTGLLLDLLENTPGSRIVNVSSGAHKIGNINFDDLAWEKRPYKEWKAYGDSKIANLYFTYELHRRLKQKNSNVIAAASHPGWTSTDLQRHNGFFNFLNPFFAQKPVMGALPTLFAATSPDVLSGEFFGPSGWQEMRGYPKKVDSNDLSKDEKIAEKLWQVSEQLTVVKFLSK
jgi:NAD(P)-dependent dehydrogenase (short-subunit alcohol dehydrogenase family)